MSGIRDNEEVMSKGDGGRVEMVSRNWWTLWPVIQWCDWMLFSGVCAWIVDGEGKPYSVSECGLTRKTHGGTIGNRVQDFEEENDRLRGS